jgi:hypothetical protein
LRAERSDSEQWFSRAAYPPKRIVAGVEAHSPAQGDGWLSLSQQRQIVTVRLKKWLLTRHSKLRKFLSQFKISGIVFHSLILKEETETGSSARRGQL